MKDPVGIFGKEKVPSPKIEFREVPLTPSLAANTHAAAAQLWCRHEVPASSQSSHTGVLSLYWQHLEPGQAGEVTMVLLKTEQEVTVTEKLIKRNQCFTIQ